MYTPNAEPDSPAAASENDPDLLIERQVIDEFDAKERRKLRALFAANILLAVTPLAMVGATLTDLVCMGGLFTGVMLARMVYEQGSLIVRSLKGTVAKMRPENDEGNNVYHGEIDAYKTAREICQKNGLRLPGLYVEYDTTTYSGNQIIENRGGLVLGLGRHYLFLAVEELNDYNKRPRDYVLGHELGHLKNKDMATNSALLGASSLPLYLFVKGATAGIAIDPLLGLSLIALQIATRFAIQRIQEFRADLFESRCHGLEGPDYQPEGVGLEPPEKLELRRILKYPTEDEMDIYSRRVIAEVKKRRAALTPSP